jgi:hypothetical protein
MSNTLATIRTTGLFIVMPLCALGISAIFGLRAYAATTTVPNTFTGGTQISAQQVNDNFAALQTAIADLQSKPKIWSSSSSQVAVESGNIFLNGTSHTYFQVGSWIKGIVRTDVGQGYITLSPGIFSDTPNCTCGASVAGGGWCQVWATSATQVSYGVIAYNDNYTEGGWHFGIMCQGPH